MTASRVKFTSWEIGRVCFGIIAPASLKSLLSKDRKVLIVLVALGGVVTP